MGVARGGGTGPWSPPIDQDFKGDLAIYRPLSRIHQHVAPPNRKSWLRPCQRFRLGRKLVLSITRKDCQLPVSINCFILLAWYFLSWMGGWLGGWLVGWMVWLLVGWVCGILVGVRLPTKTILAQPKFKFRLSLVKRTYIQTDRQTDWLTSRLKNWQMYSTYLFSLLTGG